MAVVQDFIAGIGAKIIAHPDVKAAVQDIITSDKTRAAVEKLLASESTQASVEALLGRVITKQVVPLIPVAAGVAATEAMNQALKRFPGADQAIKTGVDAVQAIDGARNALNGIVPDIDFGGPVDAFLDWWRPPGQR